MKNLSLLVFTLIFFSCSSVHAMFRTPDFYKCENRQGGKWNFGMAPYICSVDPFIDQDYVQALYHAFTFNNVATNEHIERRRYMQKIVPIVIDVAKYFIEKRNPDVSVTEKNYWIRAILSVAHQESFFSHYREKIPGNIHFMRGDYGHGHGLFQVDDRWHIGAVDDGRAANLVFNMMYSMDEYYQAWIRSSNVSCVGSETNYIDRARSAYSAYNGGPGRICRWTNPHDRWYRNDRGFFDKFVSKKWESYVDDLNLKSGMDIDCVLAGGDDCYDRASGGNDSFIDRRLYSFNNSEVCLYQDGEFKCLPSLKDRYCLSDNKLFFLKNDFLPTNHIMLDRHQQCLQQQSMHRVGATIKVLKNINIRKTPAGVKLALANKGEIFQILDFKLEQEGKRYYQIIGANATGYIYAGMANDHGLWSTAVSEKLKVKLIADRGDKLNVVAIKVFALNGVAGEIINEYVTDDTITVKDIVITGEANSIWYQNNQHEFFYGGHLLPQRDTTSLFKFSQSGTSILATLENVNWYIFLKDCPRRECARNRSYIKGPKWESEQFSIISQSGDYYKILKDNRQTGWLHKYYVRVI